MVSKYFVQCGRRTAGILSAILVFTCGCTISVMPDAGPAPSGGGAVGGDGLDATVTVRFRNLTTSDAVDVEFFATNEPVDNLPDDLFLDSNSVTASIGLAGSGLIGPGQEDEIEFPCTEDLVLGTLGGTFLDDESGETQGTGDQRWSEEGPQFSCGAIIVFEYSTVGDAFVTQLKLE